MNILESVYVSKLVAGEKLTWHGRYHSHKENEFELHFFVDGEGSFLSNNARYSIQKNSLFLSGPHEFHSIIPQLVTRPLTYYAILFSLDETIDKDLYELLSTLHKNTKNTVNNNLVDSFSFNEILSLSLSNIKAQKIAANYLLSSYIFRWFGDVILNNTDKEVDSSDLKKSKDYVRKAIHLMKKNIDKPSVLDDISWKLNLSTEHFIRLFKLETDITPHQYWLRLRVQSACTQLITSSKSIGVIAKEQAFENQFHFSRVFKKCTGLSPSEYRENYTDTENET